MTKKTRGFGLAMKKMADGGMAGPVDQLATRGLQNKTGPIGMQPRDAGMMSLPDQASMSAPMSASMPGAGMAAQSIPAPQSFNAVPGSRTMKKGGTVKKMASGGRASSYNDMTGGAGGGIGRLEKTSIAAKTVSQKLKKGGKVKGYYSGGDIGNSGSGGDYLTEGDRLAMKKAGLPEGGDRSMEMAAYRARQDKREADAAAAKKRAATPKNLPANTTGTGRIQPYSNTDAQAERMYQGITHRENEASDRDELKNMLATGEPYFSYSTPDGVVARSMGPSTGEDYGNARGEYFKDPTTSVMPEGATSGTIRDLPEGDIRQMYRANKDFKKGGKVMKMAKGGKVKNFEGSAKDMAQDKKMAKARGMTLKEWEASSDDVKHDTKKGMKKGGHVAGCKCMACGGKAGYAKGGMTEGSPREEAMDKRQAKKAGMSMAKFENSSKDVDKMAGGGMSDLMAALAPMKPIVKSARSSGVMPMRTMSRPLGMRGNSRGPTMAPPSGEAMMAKGGKASFKKQTSGVRTVKNNTLTGADMKPDGKKPALRGLIEPKTSQMMDPLGKKKGGKIKKMATGGKVRGAGIAQRGFGFKPGA